MGVVRWYSWDISSGIQFHVLGGQNCPVVARSKADLLHQRKIETGQTQYAMLANKKRSERSRYNKKSVYPQPGRAGVFSPGYTTKTKTQTHLFEKFSMRSDEWDHDATGLVLVKINMAS